MGARPADYEKAAPYKSYIHVDQFKGPRELAEYLLELDKDDQKYNQYFQVSKFWGKSNKTLFYISVERYRTVYKYKIFLQNLRLASWYAGKEY